MPDPHLPLSHLNERPPSIFMPGYIYTIWIDLLVDRLIDADPYTLDWNLLIISYYFLWSATFSNNYDVNSHKRLQNEVYLRMILNITCYLQLINILYNYHDLNIWLLYIDFDVIQFH